MASLAKAPSGRAVWRQTAWGRVLRDAALSPLLLFMVAPSLIVVPMALTSKNILQFPPSGLSLHTFGDAFSSGAWRSAAATSLEVAAIAVVLSCSVGSLAAIGLHGARFPGRGVITGIVMLPLTIPVVVLALGDFAFLAHWHLIGTKLGIALMHSVLATPYVFLMVSASLSGLDERLVRSARSLGAGPGSVFRYVYLPTIRLALLGGALFAFAVSFDEAVIANFLQGPSATTLPVKMYTDIQFALTPTIAAVSTMLLGVTAVLLLAQIWFMRRRARLALVPIGAANDGIEAK